MANLVIVIFVVFNLHRCICLTWNLSAWCGPSALI